MSGTPAKYPWITLAEAADALGLSPITLRRQIARGKLVARKVGRDWAVNRSEVARYGRENQRPWAD